MLTDGQRDMTMVIVTCLCFASATDQDKRSLQSGYKFLQEIRPTLPVHYLTLYLKCVSVKVWTKFHIELLLAILY